MLVAVRRNRIPPGTPVAPLQVADLEIDALGRRITQRGREVRLSPSEHLLLYMLAAKSGTVMSHAQLADALGTASKVRANTIARHMATLRQKLGDDFEKPRYIETVPGVGYRFIGAIRE